MNGYPIRQMKREGSTPRRTRDTNCDPQRQAVRSRAVEAEPGAEQSRPRESDGRPDREVRVELQGSELWKRFYEIGTEMIITKAGRYKKMWRRKILKLPTERRESSAVNTGSDMCTVCT